MEEMHKARYGVGGVARSFHALSWNATIPEPPGIYEPEVL